ncbi:MAG TPA: carbohydrate ABC transporter permease, partial [Chloroflexota bacterium]|nr:carbohydrate ABC transporter permease [Chloroflexota bacterium]
PLGIVAALVNFDAYPWGQLMAGALLGSIPIAIIYSFFVEHYATGLTAGAIKG